jgi:DNA-binding GntR family transcriptional regulator
MPPRYKVIAHLIQRSIATGDLAPGQFLPGAEELALRYGASPEDVRLAISHLGGNGLIAIHADHGAAVSDPPAQSHFTSAAASFHKPVPTQDSQFRESADRVGLIATHRAEIEAEPASDQIAVRLEIDIGQQVLHRRTVRHTDAVPTVLEDSYYPCDLVGTEPAAIDDITDDFLHGLGWTRAGWTDAVTARFAVAIEIVLLELDDATPVIDRTRICYAMKDKHARPVSYTHSVLVGGRNRLMYDLKQHDLPRLDEPGVE